MNEMPLPLPILAEVRVRLLTPTAKPPIQAHPGDAGYDLFADEDVAIAPYRVLPIRLGIATEFQLGYVALLWDRSGMGRGGIHRFAGVIDSTYRGEWQVCLFNSTPGYYHIRQGQKIVQVLFQSVYSPMISVQDYLNPSQRGDKGFGSTGNT